MAITTENVIINGTTYKHTWSSTGYMIKRNDGKDFVEAYDPTSSTYTYTETTTLAKQSLAARLAALETSHNTLTTRHNSLEALPHIIETGTSQDGLSWYKLYSDKCCEQFGLTACTVATTTTVNLFLPYKNTQYNIILQPNRVAQDIWGHGDTIPPESITTSSFGIYIHSSGGSYNLFWRTVGYIN